MKINVAQLNAKLCPTMNFLQKHKTILKIFYYSGLLPCRVDIPTQFSFIHCCAKYGQVIHCVILSIYLIIHAQHEIGIRLIEELLMLIFVSFYVATSFFVLMQHFLHGNEIREILRSFRRIESSYVRNLQHRIAHEAFNKTRTTKVSIVVGARIVHLCIYTLRRMLYPQLPTIGTKAGLLKIQFIFTLLYVQFFIDAILFFFSELNIVIQREVMTRRRNVQRICSDCQSDEMHDILLHYKTIHFQLWIVCDRFNRVFGWWCVAAMLNMSVDLIYSAFWLFEEIRRQTTVVRTIRRFSITFLLFETMRY